MAGAAPGPLGPFFAALASSYKLVDVKGLAKNAYRFSVGKKATSSKVVRDMVRKVTYRRSLVWQRCLHPAYDQPLTLIICRPGKKGRQPWYLLTNEEVKSDRHAWQLVFAYARRWQVEQAFRFNKSEMGMESCRLWFWDNRMKLLQIVTLVTPSCSPCWTRSSGRPYRISCGRAAIEQESGAGKLPHRFTASDWHWPISGIYSF